jgi:hypothetical protein
MSTDKQIEVGAKVSAAGGYNREMYTVVRLGKDDDCLVEGGDGSRVWFKNNSLRVLPASQSDSEDRLVIVRQRYGFDVHFNGMIANEVNFEEMLGCVIRSFSESMGAKTRYFMREKTEPHAISAEEIENE